MRAGEIVLMGPPGSGKGTQARLLADSHGWVHVATGDLFRDHARRRTALGLAAREYMERGAYVPDDVTVGMVRERLREVSPDDRLVFDGFPRTVTQAEALDSLLGEFARSVHSVVLIDVPREELLSRLRGRVTCGNCQATYSAVAHPPRVPGVCDRCGASLTESARPDESPEVVARRLAVYEEQTAPLVERYAQRGQLQRVDGHGAVREVAARLAEAVE